MTEDLGLEICAFVAGYGVLTNKVGWQRGFELGKLKRRSASLN